MRTTQTRIGPADHGRRMTLGSSARPTRSRAIATSWRGGSSKRRRSRTTRTGRSSTTSARPSAPIDAPDRSPTGRRRAGPSSSSKSLRGPTVTPTSVPSSRGRPRTIGAVASRPGRPRSSPRGRRHAVRDYDAKRRDYLEFGLREYSFLHPELQQVTVLSRREGPGGAASGLAGLSGEEPIGSPLLPGFRGRVADLWIDAEPDGDQD